MYIEAYRRMCNADYQKFAAESADEIILVRQYLAKFY